MPNTKGKKILLAVVVIAFVIIIVVPVVMSITGVSIGRGRIGVIEIEGTITDLKSAMEDVVNFREDPGIEGVILRIDSPGGAVGPTQEMFAELQKLKKVKKIYVSMGSVCASGGYYIATAGDKVYASPSTLTGSIGVIMQQAVVEDLMKKIGIEANTLKAGALKDTGSPFRKMTDGERKYLQAILDSIHEQFIADVARGRKMPVEKAKELADGRVFTGLQAKESGMIDRIGTFYDVVDDMKATLNIKGKATLVYGKRPLSILRWLISETMEDLIVSKAGRQPVSFLYRP